MTPRTWRLLRLGAAGAVVATTVATATQVGVVYVGGGSMEPAYQPGDLVVYSRHVAGASAGDVVFVRSADAPRGYVHRVIDVGQDGWLRTQGDANASADREVIGQADVAGVAVGRLPTGWLVESLVAGGRWCYNRLPIANTRR